MSEPAAAFAPPPYPYDALGEVAATAAAHLGGAVDCSVGTPCDPPPEVARQALASSGTERGYPPAAGSKAFLEAAARWLKSRFAVAIEATSIAPCVGTKELVASVPQHLRLRRPDRDTVLYPAVSYPTYAMGARLGGCRAVGVPPGTSGPIDLDAVAPEDAERALVLWVNSPANPSGELTDLARVADWGRRHGVAVFSDECYAEFTWAGPPRTVLAHGTDNVVAVHSLSKRSNMAGLRVGFLAGDPDLVAYLREVRRHAGLMVPGPVQAAAAAALGDQEHVEGQRHRYAERLAYLSACLGALGVEAPLPAGGFYLWARSAAAGEDGWALTRRLAREVGLLVSPGELYGEAGQPFARVAAVQPMERLRLIEERQATYAAGRG